MSYVRGLLDSGNFWCEAYSQSNHNRCTSDTSSPFCFAYTSGMLTRNKAELERRQGISISQHSSSIDFYQNGSCNSTIFNYDPSNYNWITNGLMVDASLGLGVGIGGSLFLMTDGSQTALYISGYGFIGFGIDVILVELFAELLDNLSGGDMYNVRSEATLDDFTGFGVGATVQFINTTGELIATDGTVTELSGFDAAAGVNISAGATAEIGRITYRYIPNIVDGLISKDELCNILRQFDELNVISEIVC